MADFRNCMFVKLIQLQGLLCRTLRPKNYKNSPIPRDSPSEWYKRLDAGHTHTHMRRRPHKIRMNAAGPQLSAIWQGNSVPPRMAVFSSHRQSVWGFSVWNCVYNGRKYEWMGGLEQQAVTMSSERRYTPREVACDALLQIRLLSAVQERD